MAKRYFAKRTFFVGDPRGNPRGFKKDYVHQADGLPGYPELPDWLGKSHRQAFDVVDVGPPVEQATAAPGEKRTRKPRKPKGQSVGVEAATETDEATGV